MKSLKNMKYTVLTMLLMTLASLSGLGAVAQTTPASTCQLAQDKTGVTTLNGCAPPITQLPWSASVTFTPVFPPPPSADDNRYCPNGVAQFGTTDGPAILPQKCINTASSSMPTPGKVIVVQAGASVATAFAAAQCGDILMLEKGVVFKAPLTWAKSCPADHWIQVRSNESDLLLPQEGERATPGYAGVLSLPGYFPYKVPSGAQRNSFAKIELDANRGIPALAGASHIHFGPGLEFTRSPGGVVYGLMATSGSDHVVFERNWWHGLDGAETARGITINNASYVGIVNNFFSDFISISNIGTITDSQAIAGGNSTGTAPNVAIKIVNNVLVAATENILFGGACSNCPSNQLTDQSYEIRRNFMYKPQTWNPKSPTYNGGYKVGALGPRPPSVKNIFELKNAAQVLIEENVMVSNWDGFSQNGSGALFTSRNDPKGSVNDITFRRNRMSQVCGGLQLSNTTLSGFDWSIHDVIIDGIQYPGCSSGAAFTNQIAGQGNPAAGLVLHNVAIDHITEVKYVPSENVAQKDNGFINYGGPAGKLITGIHFDNSITTAGIYGVRSTGAGGCPQLSTPLLSLNACWATYTVTGNLLTSGAKVGPVTSWPAGNQFPIDQAHVGYVNLNNGVDGDYHLALTSPYKCTGVGCKDPGADIDAVMTAVAGVMQLQ